MDNFDLRKYLTEGKLLKENIDFPELEDEFEGAMDAMVVEPEVYLQDIIDASADEIVSDSYYEIMNAVEQGIYSKDEAVKLAKSWAKEKLSTLAEGRQLKESLSEAFNPFLDTEEGGYMREYIDNAAEEEGLDLGYRNEFDEAFKIALSRLSADSPELDFNLIIQNKESFF